MRDPHFCWWCGVQLRPGQSGALLYVEISGPDGFARRVHKACAEDTDHSLNGHVMAYPDSLRKPPHE